MSSRILHRGWGLRRPLAAAIFWLAVVTPGPLAAPENEKEGLLFSHKIHVMELEIDCLVCHEDGLSSRFGLDDLLTPKGICAQCHDVEDPDACTMCHRESPPGDRFSRILDYSATFSHAQHLKENQDCNRCHLGVTGKENIESRHLPSMTECMSCHGTKRISNACLVCHLPDEELRPEEHLFDWEHQHPDYASLEPERCEKCHTVDMCQECHQGDNLFRRAHPANYELDHAFEARGQEHECSSCHDASEFCAACHRENGIVSHPVFDRTWANRSDGGRHGEEAEYNLGSCLACHDEGAGDPVCADCHEE